MTGEPCPLCGRPIPDTGYVCPACQDRLQSRLRSAADLWEHVRDTVGHQTHVEGTGLPTHKHADPVGPTCENDACDHYSCTAIWKARVRNVWQEPGVPHEDRGPVDWGASDRAWVVSNTIESWSGRVASSRGNAPRPRIIPAKELHTIHDDERPNLCIYSDLPIGQCACGHAHQEAS